MLAHDQASELGVPRDPQTGGQIDQFERDPHGQRDEAQANRRSQRLDPEDLEAAADKQPVAGRAEALQAPKPDGQSASDSTEPMNRNGPDRIIDPQPVEQ